MPAYMIAQIEIRDPEVYRNYLAGFMPIFERYGGELLATSRWTTEVVEGDWSPPQTVLMKFPDAARARAWLDDPDYRDLARHRHRSARANLVLVSPPDEAGG